MIIIQQEERGYTVFLNDVSTGKSLSMLEFGFSRIREGVVVGPRIRRDYVMHFVLQGSGKFENIPIQAGEGFLICPGKLHTFAVDPDQTWEMQISCCLNTVLHLSITSFLFPVWNNSVRIPSGCVKLRHLPN